MLWRAADDAGYGIRAAEVLRSVDAILRGLSPVLALGRYMIVNRVRKPQFRVVPRRFQTGLPESGNGCMLVASIDVENRSVR